MLHSIKLFIFLSENSVSYLREITKCMVIFDDSTFLRVGILNNSQTAILQNLGGFFICVLVLIGWLVVGWLVSGLVG